MIKVKLKYYENSEKERALTSIVPDIRLYRLRKDGCRKQNYWVFGLFHRSLEYQTMEKVQKKTVILCVMHHRQNRYNLLPVLGSIRSRMSWAKCVASRLEIIHAYIYFDFKRKFGRFGSK
jgi:hypothetical protein